MRVAEALNHIAAGVVSVNEEDSNGEPANIVDALYAVARAIVYLADKADD